MTSPDDGPLLIQQDGAVRTLTLHRPAAFNAFDSTLKPAFLEALRRAAADADVRAVVITGSGRAFCAGQDLAEVTPKEGPAPDLGDIVARGTTRSCGRSDSSTSPWSAP